MDKKYENIMNYNIDDVSLYSIDNGESDSDSDSDIINEPTNNTDIGNNTNIRENPLSWEIIDKNDKIEDLINKINYNFHQFAIRNGGAVGAPGQNGNDGFITMSRCGIHGIPKDDANEHFDEDNNTYEISFKKDYNIIKGDIIIYGNKIFVCNDFNKDNNNTGSFKLVSEIIGEPGQKGDSFNTGSNFILSRDVKGLADIPYLFFKENENDTQPQGIILYSNKNKLFDVSEREDIMSSSLVLTNDSDGITFTKINEKNKFIPVTALRSTVKEFMISDMSQNGSTYSAKNTLSLYSNGDTISNSSNNIILGYKYNKPSISLFSKNNIYLESTDSIKLNSKYTNIDGDILNINVDKININDKILLDNNNISIAYNLNLSVIDSFILSSNKNKRIEIKNDQISIHSKEILWLLDDKISRISLNYDTSINRINTTFSNSNITINGDIDCINLKCKKNDAGTGGIAEIDSLNINNDLNITIDENKEKKSLKQIIKDLRDKITELQQQVANKDESGNLPLGTIISTFNSNDNLSSFTNIGYHLCDGSSYSTVFKDDKDSAIRFHKELTEVQLDSNADLSRFYLPDMRDKVPIAAGGKYSPSNDYGNETITLNLSNIPSHVHQYCGDGDWAGYNGKNYISSSDTSTQKRGGADNGNGRWYNTTASGSKTPIPIDITPKSKGIYYLIKIKQI